MTLMLTFASFLYVGAVVGTCQHGHRVAAVLSGETVLKAPGHRVVEYLEGKLWKKQNPMNKTHILSHIFRELVNIHAGF